jgi:hypothetical protein
MIERTSVGKRGGMWRMGMGIMVGRVGDRGCTGLRCVLGVVGSVAGIGAEGAWGVRGGALDDGAWAWAGCGLFRSSQYKE